ncbi:MAG: molybdopterin-dependent oxidoreductase [Coriobacteriaceae bacterium]|nr:molybdopterin-dependent oxidoreductase [Coriobacteriaceae bacterium]
MATQSEAFALDASPDWKLVNTEECTNICCYCAGGCGSLCSVRDGELISVEGDPDHPISQGGLCAKGASMFQLRNVVDEKTRKVIPNPGRLTRPMVRRPGASDWEEISWDEAVTSIARKVKDTRDATFVEVDQGVVANRCDGMASLGGSQQNCEEDYAIVKTMRTLGIVALDNQARV